MSMAKKVASMEVFLIFPVFERHLIFPSLALCRNPGAMRIRAPE